MCHALKVFSPCRRILLTASIIMLGACTDESAPPTAPTGPELSLPALGSPPPPVTVDKPGEAIFVDLANADSTFAGIFVDGDQLVVLTTDGTALTDPGRNAAIRASVDGKREELGPAPATITVRQASYSFNQLNQWRNQTESAILAVDDVVALDLDEVRNGLTMYLKQGAGEDEVRAIAQQANIPSGALNFEISGEIVQTVMVTDTVSLTDRFRPVRGAFQFEVEHATGYKGPCTIGFNAIMNGLADTVFVTASHCTAKTFGLDNGTTKAYQNDIESADYIGNEFADPPPVYQKYRHSDAAAFKYSEYFAPPADRGLGRIARTTSKSFGTSSSGSTTVDHNYPYFEVTGKISWPTAGSYYQRIGIASGWTYGGIKATCSSVKIQGGYTVNCAYKINDRTTGGDSGAPVFYWPDWETWWTDPDEKNKVDVAGMIFAKDSNHKGWFSPLGSIEDDLGTLKVY